MKPEEYFFKYAFPCAWVKLERKELSRNKYNELKRRFLKNMPPNRKELEEIFYKAFFWIRQLAKDMNKSKWNLEVLQRYWRKEHNRIVEEEDIGIPKSLKDLCKIHEAEVIEKKRNKLIVKYNNSKRVVFNSIVPDASVGNIVTIHYAYAIELI
jgi:hydrogenase maturation factor